LQSHRLIGATLNECPDSPPRRRLFRLRAVVFGLTAAASCKAAYFLAQNLARWLRAEPVAAANSPTEFECQGLTIAASDLDLGDVWETSEFIHDMTIRNPSGSEKQIGDFATSCLCTAVEPRSAVIPAGGTAIVHVHIDPTHRSPDQASLAVRPVGVEITPMLSTSQPHEAGWQIHGVFRSRVTLNVLSLHFGETVVQGLPSPMRKATATVHVPMQGLQAKVEPAGVAAVSLAPAPDNPARVEIHISPANTLPVGPFKGEVRIDVVDASGAVLAGAVLPIAGEIQPEARLLPARVLLGVHPVGTSAETVVALQAPMDAPWTVEHMEADSPDVFVEATTAEGIPAGRAFRVRQRVMREGDQTDMVRFVVRKGSRPPMTLTMEVTVHGELPRPVAPPQSGSKQP